MRMGSEYLILSMCERCGAWSQRAGCGFFLDVVVYLDGGVTSVLPCIEGVGGGEGADEFDDVGELCFGSIGLPWAGVGMGSCVVGE